MKKLQEEASTSHANLASMEVRTKVTIINKEHNPLQFSSSFFGPCCTNGCQYCRPNCYEQFKGSSSFF
ncbi:MAG TPA: hypothetical protein DEF42_21980 [Desulfosporosinus sp.]|nr:hypothetical protein [Desulfosporosinus sp.]